MLLALLLVAAQPAVPLLSADRIKADVRALAADDMAGRGPGEAGETRAIAYIARAFAAAGLRPGGPDGSWYQDVPLVRLDRQPDATAALTIGGRRVPLAFGTDVTLGGGAGETALAAAPLVFAGYGVAGHGFDPYAGIDMRGKIAVVLAGDPDFEAGRDLGFEGRRLAYEGRIGTKAAAAQAAGAAGLLTIHEDAAASYPFSQVASGDAVARFVHEGSPPQTAVSGWLRGDRGAALLAGMGLDLARAKRLAQAPAFRARDMGATLDAHFATAATPVVSHNVVGVLPGTTRAAETVLYGAHWDANGTANPDATGDRIRNGAIDNGIGTATLIEVARAFAAGPRPQRSVVFAAWTAEEKGLLGAEWYAAHPLRPLETTAAVFNLDPHQALGLARDLDLVGGGRTPLEADLRRVAASQGLAVRDEINPEAGWYFRSDHYAFARRGVPTVYFRAGRDLVDGGDAAGQRIVGAYNARCYHQQCDAFDPAWTLAGAAQEGSVALLLGRDVAGGGRWPGWNPGEPLDKARAASAAARR